MTLILNNQNYCATIVKIHSTVSLNGLDNLVGAPLFGFTALIPKWYDLNQLYVLFTAESQLSERYCHENNLFDKPELNKDKEKKGYVNSKRRVRAIKLKGNISSAFIMSLDSLSYTGVDLSTLKEGDVFNIIGGEEICKKYIIKYQHSQGQGKPRAPKIRGLSMDAKVFPEHIDTSHWARNQDKIDGETDIIVSQKIHGSSFRLTNQRVMQYPKWLVKLHANKYGNKVFNWIEKYFRKFEYKTVAGSRTVIKLRDSENTGYYNEDIWNKALDRIAHLIPKNWVIYGELVGWVGQSAIQKNYTYDVPQGDFHMYIYRIAIVNEDGLSVDLSFDCMHKWCTNNGLMICPEMWRGKKKDFDYAKYMDIRYKDVGYTQCVPLSNKDTVDEGVVVRVDGDLTPKLFKAKSPIFLGHETKQLDDNVVSIEDEESNVEGQS